MSKIRSLPHQMDSIIIRLFRWSSCTLFNAQLYTVILIIALSSITADDVGSSNQTAITSQATSQPFSQPVVTTTVTNCTLCETTAANNSSSSVTMSSGSTDFITAVIAGVVGGIVFIVILIIVIVCIRHCQRRMSKRPPRPPPTLHELENAKSNNVTYENVEKPMPSIAEIQIRHDQIDRYRRDPTATKPKRRSLLQIMLRRKSSQPQLASIPLETLEEGASSQPSSSTVPTVPVQSMAETEFRASNIEPNGVRRNSSSQRIGSNNNETAIPHAAVVHLPTTFKRTDNDSSSDDDDDPTKTYVNLQSGEGYVNKKVIEELAQAKTDGDKDKDYVNEDVILQLARSHGNLSGKPKTGSKKDYVNMNGLNIQPPSINANRWGSGSGRSREKQRESDSGGRIIQSELALNAHQLYQQRQKQLPAYEKSEQESEQGVGRHTGQRGRAALLTPQQQEQERRQARSPHQ